MELVEFLHARLDEAAQAARLAQHANGPGRWRPDWRRLSYHHFDARVVSSSGEPVFDGYGAVASAEFAVRQDPERVLADVDAKRQLVAAYAEVAENDIDDPYEYATGWANGLGQAVRIAALPYAGHPDYDEAWRP